jgi:NarL family two-component system response regulator LiaR
MQRIRVVLVEDNDTYLTEVRDFLTETPGLDVVGAYTHGHDAIEGILATRPDVALVDLQLADAIAGGEVIRRLYARGSTTECLVLTVYDDDASLFAALQAGAAGYIVKNDTTLSEIVQAIQSVIDGGAPMSLGIARRILAVFRQTPATAGHPLMQGLTHREREVLEFLATGRTSRQVAQELFISYETVRCHQKNIYRKLQVHSLVEALAVLRDGPGA